MTLDKGDGRTGEFSGEPSPVHVPSYTWIPARTRRVAILGFGETVRDAPFADPSWELWAMNGWWRAAKPAFGIDVPEDRYALWFDMHPIEYTRAYGKRAGFGDEQERWLERPHPFPVLSVAENPAWPSVKAYPIEDAIRATGRDYFTSTIAYALAYALTLNDVAEVGLWGVDLTHDSEYADQRPCAEFLLGIAAGRGLKVTIHERSALLRQRYRYGYEGESPALNEIVQGIESHLKVSLAKSQQCREESDAKLAEMHTNDGAAQAFRVVMERIEVYRRGGKV